MATSLRHASKTLAVLSRDRSNLRLLEKAAESPHSRYSHHDVNRQVNRSISRLVKLQLISPLSNRERQRPSRRDISEAQHEEAGFRPRSSNTTDQSISVQSLHVSAEKSAEGAPFQETRRREAPAKQTIPSLVNSVWSGYGIDYDTPLHDRYTALGLTPPKPDFSEEGKLLKKMFRKSAQDKRVAYWSWRISQEEIYLRNAGWFPFFVTLTLDPNKVDVDSFWQSPTYFKDYIRSLARISAHACGHARPYTKANPAPESDYLHYVACLEHGKSRKHHHVHIMLWMRAIPNQWKYDPNLGQKGAPFRELKGADYLWKYGFSNVCFWRTKSDIWSELGFKMPDKTKVCTVGVAGSYLTKYMTKDEKEWNHRIKATRGLGLRMLRETLAKMEIETLEGLTWRPREFSFATLISRQSSVPNGLLRVEAKLMHFSRQLEYGLVDFHESLMQKFSAFSRMRSSVTAGARPDRMDLSDFYDWLDQCLPEETGYSEPQCLAAHKAIGVTFPPRVFKPKHIVFTGT